ncbi:hypothetical protein GCM10027020_31690 [Nocardioides salsibiostraticola]
MSDAWELSDAEIDSMLEELEAVDAAAAAYLIERVPRLNDDLTEHDGQWVAELAQTMSPSELPEDDDIEAVSATLALQHVDWLGLALGVVRRGPGGDLDPQVVQDDIEQLDEIDGEIEDPEGHLAVLEMALLHLTPLWQDLGVLDANQRLTERGIWGLPRALHRIWSNTDEQG